MENNQYKIKHPYIKVFFTAYIMFLITMLPILILSKGAYLYAGDYNVQTIPFTEHGSRLFHSSDPFPIYDWQSSLGMNTLTAYGGYFFSPFSLLLFTVPVKILKYFHTFVVALKMGITALGTYIYCKQYVKQDRSAFICGILYAFSGFQLFNLVYPFMDTIALFPLTLYAFDQLMYKRRSGWFAVMLCINGIISTYFLWQECVFILIYFLVRVIMKTYPGFDLKLFFKLAFETLVGVGLTAAFMIPGLISLTGNSRAGKLIFESNLVAYEAPGVILKAIESMFFPPDLCGNGFYFSDRKLSLDPPNLYIPLFIAIGVFAILKRDKKSWYRHLLSICAIIACVPFLNSVFSMLNNSYYARWMYMPVLIMVMITGLYIDDIHNIDVKNEFRWSCYIIGFLLVWGIYLLFHNKFFSVFWTVNTAIVVLSLILFYYLSNPTDKLRFVSDKNLSKIVCTICALLFLSNTYNVAQQQLFEQVKNENRRLWNEGHDIELDDDCFFRASADVLNGGLPYGIPTIDFFNSMCTGEETDFYSRVGLSRYQNTNLSEKDYAIYTFLSAKYALYYRGTVESGDPIEPEYVNINLKGFDDYLVFNQYNVFVNSTFIPMGFVYDYYLNIKDFKPILGESQETKHDSNDLTSMISNLGDKMSSDDAENDEDSEEPEYKYTDLYDNEKLLLKAIWLTDAQIKKYGDILTELPEELAEDTSYETYLKDCKARAASACYEFEPDGKGFSAKIDLEKDNLVFFSIPYDKGFTAYVDGQETEIEKVFDGLSAVYVPAGDHSIRFDYRLLGLKEGMAVTTVCLVLFALYCCGCFVLWVRRRRSPVAAIAAEQTTAETLPENASEAVEITAKEESAEGGSAETPHDEE